MKTVDRLVGILQDREESGHSVQALVVSPRVLRDLRMELLPWAVFPVEPNSEFLFMGVPVRRKRLTMFCKNCGAPAEGKACSYCGTDPDEMEVI